MASHTFANDDSPGSSQATSPGPRQALKGDGSSRQPFRKYLASPGYFDEPASPAATQTTIATPLSHGMSSVQSPLSIASASSWFNDSIHDINAAIDHNSKKPQPAFLPQDEVHDREITTPAEAHLDEPRLPTIQIQKPVDPTRPWLGTTPVPSSRDHDEGEVQEDYGVQTAVAVQVLPSLPPSNGPIDAIEPLQRSHLGNPLDAQLLHFNTTQNAPKPRQVDDKQGTLRKKGKRKILMQKYIFQASLLSLNGFLIFVTWYFTAYWYALIPFISLAVVMNTIMILSLLVHETFRKIKPLEREVPETPESLVLLVPCYNENQEEFTRSFESLHEQQEIEDHQQCIFIISDGRARGPGMDKSCADTLLDDVLVDNQERRFIAGGYTACDQQPMDVVVQRGQYKGTPYVCLIKQQNQGKRVPCGETSPLRREVAPRTQWAKESTVRFQLASTTWRLTFCNNTICPWIAQRNLLGIESVSWLLG